MNILIAFFVIVLIQLNIYVLLNSGLGILKLNKLIKDTFTPQNKVVKAKVNQPNIENHISVNSISNTKALLGKNLKHLELISEFELYLESKNYKKFSIELFQELERLKTKAQLSTLKSTSQLNDNISHAV